VNLFHVFKKLKHITQTSVISGGRIISDGGASILSRGVCWSIDPEPTVIDSVTIDGKGPGTYVSSVTLLLANKSYYLRAYATNSTGTGYGSQILFSTKEYDSVNLKYVDIDPDTTFINLSGTDSITISVEYWTSFHGPISYQNDRIWIKSNNPSKILLSPGKYFDTPLEKNSSIDDSIDWFDKYESGGYINFYGYVGFRSEYVGIKIIDNNKTYYGWIHTPTSLKMTEYAIDTNFLIERKVYAGRLKK
jgi:hypothetical protein